MNSKKLFAEAVKNWPAKMLSVALALILVVFHRMSTQEERIFSVPLQVEGEGALTPSSVYITMVRVSLRGDRNSIYPILEDDIEAFVDISKYTEPGFYHVPVQIRKKGSALGVEPLEIVLDPLEISLDLDRKISKLIPLRPNLRGFVENGYELASFVMLPAQVSVDGPQKLVGNVSEFMTEEIDLAGRMEDFSLTAAIVNREPLVYIQGNGRVEFQGSVREQTMVRDFKGVPIVLTNLEGRFAAELEQKTGTAHLQGGRRKLGVYVPPEDFLALDCSGIHAPGTYTLPVKVNSASFFNLSGWEPEQVSLQISLQPGGSP